MESVPVAQFADAVAAMPAVVARAGARSVACGQVALDGGLAGIYDMVTSADVRGRGLATAIVTVLSNCALQCGASHAFLQVNDDNAAGLAVYRKSGFHPCYTYHYRGRPTECH